jgi:protein-disulfide isomerase
MWATSLACALALAALPACNARHNQPAGRALVKYAQVEPPRGEDWTQVINSAPDGGIMMGNPSAKVHLVEIGSLTCPHCREFEQTAVPLLIDKYVKTGEVSFAFRNYVRDTFDLAAVLIAKCNGPQAFFPLSKALYVDQPEWEAKIQAIPQAQLDKMQNLPPNRIALEAARSAGLLDWAAGHGLAQAKSSKCLGDTDAMDRAIRSSGSIAQDYPDFTGTPNFVINGKLNTKIAHWDDLDAALQKALGG